MLKAGGTIEQKPAGPLRKAWLTLEMIILYVAVPPLMVEAMHGNRIPIFVALIPVLIFIVICMLGDRTFHLRKELTRGFSLLTFLGIVIVAAIGAAGASYWILENKPHWFLSFPKRKPDVYTSVMILYPILSVLAQEIVYRTFFFHRYGPLFGSWIWLGLLVNAAAFGFGHIVIGTTFAVIATGIGGLLFALRYWATRSFWAVFIEHTFWGWIIFTVGLGRYFFSGIASVG